MDQLHAYWRMEYIEAPKSLEDSDDNFFASIPESKNDTENYLLHRDQHAYIMLNRFPYNAGHLLIVPYKEVPSLDELSSDERSNLMDMIIKGQNILEQALSPNGFNIGFNIGSAAGAGIPKHIHCHIVPRWAGDTNFMPVLGNTKVLPQSLDAMYTRLKEFA